MGSETLYWKLLRYIFLKVVTKMINRGFGIIWMHKQMDIIYNNKEFKKNIPNQ